MPKAPWPGSTQASSWVTSAGNGDLKQAVSAAQFGGPEFYWKGRSHANNYLSNDRRECVLISEILPGKVTALKGCLEGFEISGATDKLEAHLFVAAI
jgi:hypothetical protein